jgi:hypothetical protein
MTFITLTEHNAYSDGRGRTFYVRADLISRIASVVEPDDDPYTIIRASDEDIHVIETPEEVLRRIHGVTEPQS